MIWQGDVRHAYLIARAARAGFDPKVDACISRVDGNGSFLGGVIYTNYNGAIVMMHVAGIGNWLSPELLWVSLDYPFMHLQVKKLLCTVASNNQKSLDLVKRVGGWKSEHKIVDGVPGGDLLMFSMLRKDCRWLKLRDRYVRANGHLGEHVHVHA